MRLAADPVYAEHKWDVRVVFTRTLTPDSLTYLKYASGVFGRKPCIHIRLDLLDYEHFWEMRLRAVETGQTGCAAHFWNFR
jgi:hypothetical protein